MNVSTEKDTLRDHFPKLYLSAVDVKVIFFVRRF